MTTLDEHIEYLMRTLPPGEQAVWKVLHELVDQHLALKARVDRLEREPNR